MNSHKTFVLIILDGWGYRESAAHNPTKTAHTPTMNDLFAQAPWTLLEAAGQAVGLPMGQIGNSEVGHLHIGSGRKVPQDLTRINRAVSDGSFKKNPVFLKAIETVQKNNRAIHILGLLSPGGVHSHESHITALIEMIAAHGVRNYCHAFLDGRDVPPRSAQSSLMKITALYQKLGLGQIASLIGRYYAMDRDHRWERTQKAYRLLTQGTADYTADSATAALEAAYARGENDEFVHATTLHPKGGKPIVIEDGDIVIFMNFRADRARQLSMALTDADFNHFHRDVFPKLSEAITLTEYSEKLRANVAYPPLTLKNTLGEFLSMQGHTQLHIAETEKYAHVTYFLNGGNESPFPQETRVLVPSPKVATYDLQPEMSAVALTDIIVKAIQDAAYDVIICNYANPDMVGHTGIESAADRAVEVIDDCIRRILESLKKNGGEALITADHGNVEQMFDEKNQQPHTAHTTNRVPLIYVGRPARFRKICDAALDDVAPTFLSLMALEKPVEMTGRNLLEFIE